jgi:hypothetical protein
MNIKDILKQLLKDDVEIYSTIGTVEKIDEIKRVCTVTPLDGSAKLFNVRLQTQVAGNEGLVIFPKKDSKVIVTFLSKELAFVSSTSEIQKILLNSEGISAEMSLIKSKFDFTTLLEILAPTIALSGSITFNGGAPLTGSLSDQINGIKEDINGLKEILGAWAPSSESALKTALGEYIATPLELMEEPTEEETNP